MKINIYRRPVSASCSTADVVVYGQDPPIRSWTSLTYHTGCCNSNKVAGAFGTYVGKWNPLFVLKL